MRRCAVLALLACSRSDLEPDIQRGADVADSTSLDTNAPDAVTDVVVDAAPLQPCIGSRDVFFFDLEGSGTGYLPQKVLHTNLDSTWWVTAQPDLTILISTGAQLFSLEVLMSSSQPLSTGTYNEDSLTGPWPSLDLDGIACSINGGLITIDTMTYETSEGGLQVKSLLLSYDGRCNADFSIRGCVRYSASP